MLLFFNQTTSLPGRGDTVIPKVVFPGQGLFIAFRMYWPCDFPKCGELDCVICGSGGLRLHSPLRRKTIKQYQSSQSKTCKSLLTCLQAHCICEHTHQSVADLFPHNYRHTTCIVLQLAFPPCNSFSWLFSSQHTWSSGFLNQGCYHATPGSIFILFVSGSA